MIDPNPTMDEAKAFATNHIHRLATEVRWLHAGRLKTCEWHLFRLERILAPICTNTLSLAESLVYHAALDFVCNYPPQSTGTPTS